MSMTPNHLEVVTSVRRTASEKVRMVEETFEPGATVSVVVRRLGVAPNQLFTRRDCWRKAACVPRASDEEALA